MNRPMTEANAPETPPPLKDPGLVLAERRIVQFTLACIAATAVLGLVHWGWRAAAGVLAGGALSLVNLYWIRRVADALVRRATEPSPAHPTPGVRGGMVRAVIHFALLAAVFYAILISHFLSIGAVLTGFFSVVGGIVLEAIRETVNALGGHASA